MIKRHSLVVWLVALWCIASGSAALAQASAANTVIEAGTVKSIVADAPLPPNPKVALVLSGGGALGLAHIGVIKELERLGIHPDFVVGTSMGAVVGGLYASGLTGAEIEAEAMQVDWDRVFNPAPERDGLTYRQKRNDADFPVKASVGLKDWVIKLPEGAVADQNLNLTLRTLVKTKAAVPTFDQLPIPFRAVATDIENGKPFVLDRGNLATAMRASMSVPGVFPPAMVNGRMLVDGGLANNIPVDVARELGADVVIVVALQAPLLRKDQIGSILDVLGQTASLLILSNERAQLATLKTHDVLIRVDISDFTAVDFKKGEGLIASGVEAALAQTEKLKPLAGGGTRRSRITPPKIDYIRVVSTTVLANEMLVDRLNYPVGKELDNAALTKGLDAIYALGAFDRVDYEIENRNGQNGLVVRAQEKKAGPAAVRVGLTVANDFDGRDEYAVSFDYRISPLDRFGSEARIEGVFGGQMRLAGSYFKLLDVKQGWFVEPKMAFEARTVPIYRLDGYKEGEVRVASGIASLSGGYQFGGIGEIRLGFDRGVGDAKATEGVVPFKRTDLSIGQAFISAGVDTFDNPFFPTRGVFATLRANAGQRTLGADANFTTVEGGTSYAFKLGPGITTLQANAGKATSGTLPPESLFRLGGFTSLSGYQRDELSGEAYATLRGSYRYRLNNTAGLVNVPLYIGATLEAGNAWARADEFDWGDMRAGGSLFLAADTMFGPTFLGYGWSESNRQSAYLFIGRPF